MLTDRCTDTEILGGHKIISFHSCGHFKGFRFFFKTGRPKWPLEQKVVGHFLKWWAQAYQTNNSWHLGSILYLHTDTDTCMHICILTADYTVKPCLKRPLKKEDQSSLNAGQEYCRILQGEQSAIHSTFIKLPWYQGRACVYAKYAAAYFNFWMSKKYKTS